VLRKGVSACGRAHPARQRDGLQEATVTKISDRAVGGDAPRGGRERLVGEQEGLELITPQRPEACQEPERVSHAGCIAATGSVQVRDRRVGPVIIGPRRYTQ